MWNKIWNTNGTVQKLGGLAVKFNTNFRVYVNSDKYFLSNFPKFNITNDQSKFFSLENPYFVACCAAYCVTYIYVWNFNRTF